MENKIYKYLYDIKVSIEAIESYLENADSFEVYLENKMLRRAVEREFEIIGEAVYRIVKLNPAVKIRNKEAIMGMRNRIIHGYDIIDEEVIWSTIHDHLPLLKTEVIKMLVPR